MSYLFTTPHTGWRFESHRSQNGYRETLAVWRKKLALLETKPDDGDIVMTQRRATALKLVTAKLRTLTNNPHKRAARGPRRANPKSLEHVIRALRKMCVEAANARKLDPAREYWFLKAEMAAKLNVPEHFIAQAVHKLNLLGICDQGENTGVHDSHRDKFWGGPWVSSWQDTRYTIKLDKLIALAV